MTSSKSPNPTRNQHWLPQVFSRPWVDKNGDHLVHVFIRQPHKILSTRRSIKIVGSQDWLYTIAGRNIIDNNIFETTFGKLKSIAGNIRDKPIAEGPERLEFNEKLDLAANIMFLYNRRPEAIINKSNDGQNIFEKELRERLAGQLSSGELSEEMFENMVAGLVKQIALQAAMESAFDWGCQLAVLPWRIIRFDNSSLRLVISDNPIVGAKDQSERLTWLTMPLSPDVLFVAGTRGSHFEEQYRPEFREELAIQIIGEQFRAAREFVIATSESPYKNLADLILTPKQGN